LFNKNPTGFIRYQKRSPKADGPEYAIYCPKCHGHINPDKRVDNDVWLGKVIDKEKGIFYNKKRGIFGFTIESNYFILSDEDIALYTKVIDNSKFIPKKVSDTTSTMIGFGGIFSLTEFLKKEGLLNLFTDHIDCNKDTLISLLLFRILTPYSNKHAFDWWNETYTKYLFPNAEMKSQQISNFLIKLGEEINFHKYIIEHINYIHNLTPKYFILIDSTGLPNDIKIPITAVNNHNGVINNEIRLIMVIESNTGLPIYYRYVPGNIVDVSTLNNIINQLKEYNVLVHRAVLDAGYYSKDNLIELHNNNIPFITRMVERVIDQKQLINEYGSAVKATENYVHYNNRHMYVKKIQVTLFDGKIDAFAYLCCDLIKERHDEDLFLAKQFENTNKVTLEEAKIKFGKFMLLSTIDLDITEILPYYYTRQDIEQIFDYLKN
jgi:hypothetical protein